MGADTVEKAKEKFNISVNGKDIEIIEHPYKRGRLFGQSYFSPDENLMNYQFLIDIFGVEKVDDSIVKPFMRKFVAGITREALGEATPEGGNTDNQRFQEIYGTMFGKLDERSQSVADIKSRIEDLLGELQDESVKMTDGVPTPQFIKIASSLANLKKALNDKKSKDEEPDTTQVTSQAA